MGLSVKTTIHFESAEGEVVCKVYGGPVRWIQ